MVRTILKFVGYIIINRAHAAPSKYLPKYLNVPTTTAKKMNKKELKIYGNNGSTTIEHYTFLLCHHKNKSLLHTHFAEHKLLIVTC